MSAKQWLNQYSFYANFSLSASKDTRAQGVEWLSIGGDVLGYSNRPINIDDNSPKTEWVQGNMNTWFNIKVYFNAASKGS